MQASVKNLETIVSVLTNDIGVRLAGSPQERQAAEYLADELRKFAPKVTIEDYPVKQRCVKSEHLEICLGGSWQTFPCSLFSSAIGTDGREKSGELVFFDTVTGYQHPDLSFLRGKAVVHLGCHIESEDNYRRLMEAEPAFILFVDTRYPAAYALADGLFPAYVKKYGSVPSLNVAYQDAWKWKTEGATAACISVDSSMPDSFTTVVIAELPGLDKEAGVIYAGGHHDTQAGTVGADDNAIGSACVVELARILSERSHRRTFRLISFGAEEQLSVGSASYVRAHRAEIEQQGVFMCNFDSCGSAMGWNEVLVNGTEALRERLRTIYRKEGVYYREDTGICPYTDQFPFAACGVPGLWFSRANCASGIFFHHRVDNTLDKLDCSVVESLLTASARFLAELADDEDISAYRGIPESLKPSIADMFGKVYGGF